jgi:HEAT repeat protein
VHSNDSTLPEGTEESLLRAGFATGDDTSALIREHLEASDARQRVLALRAASRRTLLTDADWRRAMDDPVAAVRREALALLAYQEMSDTDVLEDVVRALSDDDPLVVDAAAFALGEHDYVNGVDALSEVAQHHDDARCREAAVAALGVLGDDRGRAAVLGALEDKPPVRRRAIVALTNFEGPDIDAALERAAEDRDWQVRAAVDQLSREDD